MTGKKQRWFIAVPPNGAARFVGQEIVKAFLQLAESNSIKTFDCKIYLKAFSDLLKNKDDTMIVDLLNQSLIVQCLDFQATHVLVLALCPVTLFTLNLFEKMEIVTAHWFYEDFRRANYWKEVVGGYRYFFAIQKGPIIDECGKYGSHFAFLPTAAPLRDGGGRPSAPFSAEVAFIGIPSDYRVNFLEFLVSRGIRLAIAGQGWDRYRGMLSQFIVNNQWTDPEQASDILSTAYIGINLSVIDPGPDRENTHVSPRVFDVLLAGRALLTEDVALAREVLIGCAYHTFKNQEDAFDRVRDILAHWDNETVRAAKNAEILRQCHGYRQRVERIISLTCDDAVS